MSSYLLFGVTLISAGNATASQNIIADTVVITGTRTEKVLSEVPVRTEVVTKQEIRTKNAQDLKDAIEDVPGVLLKKIHGKSGFEAWLQGVNADRVLVLNFGQKLAEGRPQSVQRHPDVIKAYLGEKKAG